LQSNLQMTEHTSNIVSKAGQNLYALKVLKSNGLANSLLHTVCQATLVSSLTYASAAWIGFTSSEDRSRLQSVFNRAYRWGLCSPPSPPNLQAISDKTDSNLFSKICTYSNHVLHYILPPKSQTHYHLRTRSHCYTLPWNTPLLKQNFLHRLLFKNSY